MKLIKYDGELIVDGVYEDTGDAFRRIDKENDDEYNKAKHWMFKLYQAPYFKSESMK